METLANYESDVLKTRLKCDGYEAPPRSWTTRIRRMQEPTTGIKARAGYFKAWRIYRLILRPHADLFHQAKLIPPGVKLNIQLVPNRAPFFIKTAAPDEHAEQAQYKFNVVSALFLVQFREVSTNMMNAHKQTHV